MLANALDRLESVENQLRMMGGDPNGPVNYPMTVVKPKQNGNGVVATTIRYGWTVDM